MILLSIRDIVVNFATKYGLDTWDYFTLLTFIISLIALVVASKTLRSQKRTQKNTTPLMSSEIQEELLMEILSYAYRNIIQIYSLCILLLRNDFKDVPEESLIRGLSLPIDYIHEELFYSDGNKFYRINSLKNQIENYNLYVASVSDHLYENGLSYENINRMYGLLNTTCAELMATIEFIYDNEIFNNPKFQYKKRCKKRRKDGRNVRVYLSISKHYKNQGRDYKIRQLIRRYYMDVFPYYKLEAFPFATYIKESEIYSNEDSISQFAFQDDESRNDYYLWTNRLIEECISSDRIVFINKKVKNIKKRCKITDSRKKTKT